MSVSGFVARCDVDGCEHDAYWRAVVIDGKPSHRVDCPAHPLDWPATPLTDTRLAHAIRRPA